MSELSFLLTLLLDHKLSTEVKGLIKERIKEIEFKPQINQAAPVLAQKAILSGQAPSTIANLMKEPSAQANPEMIAVTPAASQAMASRQEAIALAMSGKPEKGRQSPRKF